MALTEKATEDEATSAADTGTKTAADTSLKIALSTSTPFQGAHHGFL